MGTMGGEDIRVEGTSGWGWVKDARAGDTLGIWGTAGAGGVLETWGHPELGTPQGHGDRGVGDPHVGDLGTPGLGTPEDIRVEGTSGWGWVRDARVGDTLGGWGTAGLGASWRLGDTLGTPRDGDTSGTWGQWGWGPQGWGQLHDLGTPGLGTPWGSGGQQGLGASWRPGDTLGTPGVGTPQGFGGCGVVDPRVGDNFMTWGPQGWGHLGVWGTAGAGGVLKTWGHPELGMPQGHGDRGVGVPRVGDLGTPEEDLEAS